MGMKFLNKKGWHTGSLRNIENVWKAEQKHDAEQRKLEELRKQIHEEREKSEFRLLQEQAGLLPKQERLDFLYDSGLSVGKGANSQQQQQPFPTKPPPEPSSSSSAANNNSSAPGALFEDKPQSANDAWRKLHTDPLLMIKQREQEALARVKNNPVQMAMIRKSVEAKKHKEKPSDEGNRHRKKQKHSKHHVNSDDAGQDVQQRSISDRHQRKDGFQTEHGRTSDRHQRKDGFQTEHERTSDRHQSKRYNGGDRIDAKRDRDDRKSRPPTHHKVSDAPLHNRTRQLSKEDRAAKLKEMQMDAELHEEQRWRRLKQADVDDAKEVTHASSSGRNFLDAAHKSVYGADKGGSSTIEESVRRRTHYSQRRSEGNAFRR